MKKVLLIAIAAVMLATPALAVITGSAHDFSANVPAVTDEICIYCHTPHNAQTITNAPLWDHVTTTATYTLYTSSTLDATTLAQPSGISKLCLSCHDNTVAIDSFGTNAATTTISAIGTGTGNLGVALGDDHPVGFAYDAALFGADSGLKDPASAPIAALLFATQMECSSCHDVHNNIPVGAASLLRVDNAASALCLTCHAK